MVVTEPVVYPQSMLVSQVGKFPPVTRGGVILLILGSIPNSADPMVVWFFSFS